MSSHSSQHIATSSVGEGLDFACSLISAAVAAEGDANREKAHQLLRELANYVEFRYAGELLLAAESLAGLGHECSPESFRSAQFWSQLRWVAGQMELAPEELSLLRLPE